MLLEEATFDDLLVELKRRYPNGVVLAVARPSEGKIGEPLDEDMTIGYYRLIPAIGLTTATLDALRVKAQDQVTSQTITEDDDDDDE